MNLIGNYGKLKKHLKDRGFFLTRRKKTKTKGFPSNMIAVGRIRMFCYEHGVTIFWDDAQVTQNIGLNIGINTLGLWTDSSKASFEIVEKANDYFNIRVTFKDLPVNQIWKIKIGNEQEINWQVDMEAEEVLCIDEIRLISLIPSHYKGWISEYEQGDFPCTVDGWHDIALSNMNSSLVGARFTNKGVLLPPFILELNEPRSGNIFPLIQSAPLELRARLIGFKKIDHKGKKEYEPGSYNLFSIKMSLFSNDYFLDKKLEMFRNNLSQPTIKVKSKQVKTKNNIKILLVNLPWQRNANWGVRAGSRWPHIKDKSEGRYLPFPFFLAYATSLLQQHDIEAHIIDAIAEEIPVDSFIKKILSMDFDYLVAETSVPSFYDDLSMLERLNRAGVPIILCGPNSEIYKEIFLKQHSFIDFVLYGEYEFTLLELARALQGNGDVSGVKGLIYRDNGQVVKNPKRGPFDINLLPMPNREELPVDRYWDLPGNIPFPSAQMLASRGCPFNCSFCLWPHVLYQNNVYRTRNIKSVVDEMEYLVKERGFKSVYFDDDTFNIGKKRMLKFCQEIKSRDLHNIPWAIMARPDLMDEEVLLEMKSAGLWAVKYGVESVFDDLLVNYRKDSDFKKTNKIIGITKRLGIRMHLTFTFGIAGETKDTIQKTIDYALSSDPDSVQFSIVTPFPGTRLFEELDKQGKILTKDWSKYDGHHNCVFQHDNLTAEDLEMSKRKAYRLWGEHVRKRRGRKGDIERFKDYFTRYGWREAVCKTADYLTFVLIKRKRYLDGKN